MAARQLLHKHVSSCLAQFARHIQKKLCNPVAVLLQSVVGFAINSGILPKLAALIGVSKQVAYVANKFGKILSSNSRTVP